MGKIIRFERRLKTNQDISNSCQRRDESNQLPKTDVLHQEMAMVRREHLKQQPPLIFRLRMQELIKSRQGKSDDTGFILPTSSMSLSAKFAQTWRLSGRLPMNQSATLRVEKNCDLTNYNIANGEEPRCPNAQATWIVINSTDICRGEEKFDITVLHASRGSHIRIDHGYKGNGSISSVYLNEYSLILDVCIKPLENNKLNEFTAILQTSIQNHDYADWYVRGDGSIGCGEYSKPGIIMANTW